MNKQVKELDCIVCPLSCKLIIQLENNNIISVTGNSCPRGEVYAKEELTAPKRMLTSTVKIQNAILPLLPVVSDEPLPKEKVQECARFLRSVTVKSPVKQNDVICSNILNLGVNILSSRDM